MKNIIITAGPTNERIDAVMKITNMSTGALGSIIADTIINNHEEAIDHIFYISPKLCYKPKSESKKIVYITIDSTTDLLQAIESLFSQYNIDCIIHSSAVGDYKGSYAVTAEMLIDEIVELSKRDFNEDEFKTHLMQMFENPKSLCDSQTKISSYEKHLMVMLTLTTKVISRIKLLNPNVKLIGFKLLENVSEDHLYDIAHKLLVKNNADYIVANDLARIGNGKHFAMVIDKSGIIAKCETKSEIANELMKVIF